MGVEEQVCTIVESKLQDFPLYDEQHDVLAKMLQDKLAIVYRTDSHLDATRFDLNIVGRTGHLCWISIHPDERRKGYGRQLYEVVENIFKEMGCTNVRLTSSGKGKEEFWKKLGFEPDTDREYVKQL